MVEAWQLRDSDWEQLDVMMYIFETFYNATKTFSDCKYPTTHFCDRTTYTINDNIF